MVKNQVIKKKLKKIFKILRFIVYVPPPLHFFCYHDMHNKNLTPGT